MRIDGRLEFRAPETSASSSCILSNTMADPVDDFNELFLFTGTQPSAVHRKRLPLIIILVLADHKEVISSLWCFVESSSNTPWYCHVPHTMFIPRVWYPVIWSSFFHAWPVHFQGGGGGGCWKEYSLYARVNDENDGRPLNRTVFDKI